MKQIQKTNRSLYLYFFSSSFSKKWVEHVHSGWNQIKVDNFLPLTKSAMDPNFKT
jgi:hypothetical protein